MDGTGMNKIIDGKAFAEGLRGRIAQQIAGLKAKHDLVPGLAVVLVGEDPASQVYVRNKAKQTVEVGMASFEHKLSRETGQAELLALVKKLNADPRVNGILVQLPLPKQIDPQAVLDAIDPAKDVDGFHVVNAGRLATGGEAMVPCTPLGCLMLLKDRLGDLSGKRAMVLGRSTIVGKPMAQLMLGESCNVTISHSRTRALPCDTPGGYWSPPSASPKWCAAIGCSRVRWSSTWASTGSSGTASPSWWATWPMTRPSRSPAPLLPCRAASGR